MPVVIIGNLTAGGVGKTPVVAAVVERARALGFTPCVVSRGHGGTANAHPRQVGPDDDPGEVGDEPLMLVRQLGVAVVVGANRLDAARLAVKTTGCDLIVGDDGLQHYRLRRDAEIVVVDGERRFGNGLLLPVGPLRESVSRLNTVDLVVANGGGDADVWLEPTALMASNGATRPCDALEGIEVDAIAGIGNPTRFFDALRGLGAKVNENPFPDHHPFSQADLAPFGNRLLVMTEKDMVKCARLNLPDNAFALRATTKLSASAVQALDAILKRWVRTGSDIPAAPSP